MPNISPRETRGFLNNNPGNMDRMAGDKWQGEIRDPHDTRLTDFQRNELIAGRFSVFVSAEYGVRAMVKNLWAYNDAYHLCTVRGLISKWAPPLENNTEAYISAACRTLGVQDDQCVDLRSYAVMRALVVGIISVECAGMPYAGKEIEDGLRMAGIVKPATLAQSSTMKGAATAATATAAQPMLAAVQDPVQSMIDTLSPLSDTSEYVQWAIVGAKVLLAAVALWGVWMMVRERRMRVERDVAIAQVQEAGL